MKSKNEDKEEKWGYMCGGEKTRENKKNKVWMEKMKREEKIKQKNKIEKCYRNIFKILLQ